MKKQPVFFDENRPLAHYAAAGKLKKSADRAILFGKIFPIVILPAGIACAIFEPLSMALFTLFGVIFTALAIIGCSIRRIGFAMAAMPLAFFAAVVLCLAKSAFSPIGAALYLIAGISQLNAMSAISNFHMLKELPGFPFFDPAMEDISFAAMEHHGADEYIAGELVEERSERIKLVPIEPPSEEMGDIVTEEIGVPDLLEEVPADEPTKYDRMINAQTEEREDISDIDLFY